MNKIFLCLIATILIYSNMGYCQNFAFTPFSTQVNIHVGSDDLRDGSELDIQFVNPNSAAGLGIVFLGNLVPSPFPNRAPSFVGIKENTLGTFVCTFPDAQPNGPNDDANKQQLRTFAQNITGVFITLVQHGGLGSDNVNISGIDIEFLYNGYSIGSRCFYPNFKRDGAPGRLKDGQYVCNGYFIVDCAGRPY
jgi:hypothetical protein